MMPPEKSGWAASAEQRIGIVVNVGASSAAFAIRAPGGEHLDEPGDRGERPVVVRPVMTTERRWRARLRENSKRARVVPLPKALAPPRRRARIARVDALAAARPAKRPVAA